METPVILSHISFISWWALTVFQRWISIVSRLTLCFSRQLNSFCLHRPSVDCPATVVLLLSAYSSASYLPAHSPSSAPHRNGIPAVWPPDLKTRIKQVCFGFYSHMYKGVSHLWANASLLFLLLRQEMPINPFTCLNNLFFNFSGTVWSVNYR